MRSLLASALARPLTFVALPIFLALAPARAQAEPTPRPSPIPVEAMFGNPAFTGPRLSPDGKRLAVLRFDGDHALVLVRAPNGKDWEALARFRDPTARPAWLEWANDELIVVSSTQRHPFIRDPREGMIARQRLLYAVRVEDRKMRWLGRSWPRPTRWTQYQDQIRHWLPNDVDHVLLSLRPPQMTRPSIVRMNLGTGELAVVQGAEHGIYEWHVDSAGGVRAGEAFHDDRYELWARVRPEEELVRVVEGDALDPNGTRFAGFRDDPNKLLVLAPHEKRMALFELDLEKRALGELLFAHPEVDVDGVATSPDPTRRVIGARFVTDRPEIRFFDAEAEREDAALGRAFERELGRPVSHVAVSSTRDGDQRILEVSSETQPAVYFYYSRRDRRLTRLLDERAAIAASALSASRRVTYSARDGLPIPAYLTLPIGREPRGLPLVVLVHGGPWARDSLRWDPEVQLLASRGFAVLRPNFRGSTGFGIAHRVAGDRQWGGKIQDDISDGVVWLVDQGVVDVDRVGIYGGSFGGYAALFGLVKTPNLYRAGAAYAAVTDIEHMIEDDRSYVWRFDWHERWIGEGSRFLRERSPLRRAAEIRVPVLIGHGEHDERVHVRQSRRMAEALRVAGKQFEYLEFPDEVHGFVLEANRVKWYEALAAFFEKNLAPREKQAAGSPPVAAAP